jgi:hypothetical protein
MLNLKAGCLSRSQESGDLKKVGLFQVDGLHFYNWRG